MADGNEELLGDLARYSSLPRDERPAAMRRALELVSKGAEYRPLLAIATRESGLNYMVEHRLPADASGARKVWERLKGTTYAENPFRGDASLWTVGRGPFGMMTPYYVARWSRTASPLLLHHPYVSSVVAWRTVASMVRSGARNWTEVNEGWASGRPRNASEGAKGRAERFRERLERAGVGFLADRAPPASPWGREGDQDGQGAAVLELSREGGGGEAPPDPTNPPLRSRAAAGVILLGTIGAALALTSRRGSSRSSRLSTRGG